MKQNDKTDMGGAGEAFLTTHSRHDQIQNNKGDLRSLFPVYLDGTLPVRGRQYSVTELGQHALAEITQIIFIIDQQYRLVAKRDLRHLVAL